MLGSTEPALMLEETHFGPPSLTRVLLCISLVCKRWSSIANGLLFKRSHVCSHASLRSYNKVLRGVLDKGSKIDFVNSLSYFPPLMELADRKRDASTTTSQGRRQDNKDLRTTFMSLPSSTTFNLKLSPPQLTYLTHQAWFRTGDLVVLHLAVPSTNKESVRLSSHFGNLRTLVLQRITITQQAVWPTMPNLQNLRLIQVDLKCSADSSALVLEPFQNLRKLELIEVRYDEGQLKPFLRRSSETLEYLSLINVGGPDYSLLVYNLGFLQALRALCIGPYAFQQEQESQARTRFPESLERLTIWELLKPKLTDSTIPSYDNVAGLQKFLSTSQFHNPNLHTVRIRGADYELRPKKQTLETACAAAHVTLEMSTYKFHTYIKPDLPLKDRAWNAATSVPNYFLSFFRKDRN